MAISGAAASVMQAFTALSLDPYKREVNDSLIGIPLEVCALIDVYQRNRGQYLAQAKNATELLDIARGDPSVVECDVRGLPFMNHELLLDLILLLPNLEHIQVPAGMAHAILRLLYAQSFDAGKQRIIALLVPQLAGLVNAQVRSVDNTRMVTLLDVLHDRRVLEPTCPFLSVAVQAVRAAGARTTAELNPPVAAYRRRAR